MKYGSILVPLFISLLLVYCQVKDNKNASLDIVKIRGIEKEARRRVVKINEKAGLMYLDSLHKSINNDSTSAYGLFLNILKVKFNSEITNEEKISYFVDKTQKPSFGNEHEYNKYKIRLEISSCLRLMGNYSFSGEECILAGQYLNLKPNLYSTELAKIYEYLGFLEAEKMEMESDPNLKIESFSQALEIYRNTNDWQGSAGALYSMSLISFENKQYEIAKQYIRQCISERSKFASETNNIWAQAIPILFDTYQSLNQVDSAYSIYRQSKVLYEKKIITEEHYATFLAETLRGMVALKNYQEVEKNINYLKSFYKDTCTNRYRYCLIYSAKSQIAKDNKLVTEEKDNLIKLLHYSSECGRTRSYFTITYKNTINRLIEIETEAKNEKNLNLLYKRKLSQNLQFQKENQTYLKHMDFWADLRRKVTQNEMTLKNEQLKNEQNRLVFISLVSIIILLALGVVFYLYKKIKINELELINKQKNLKDVNQYLAERNNKLTELYKEMDYKNNIILSQNKQMATLVDRLKESNENLSHFAQSAAHDLKAPLRTISSFSRILQKRYYSKIDEKDTEFFKFIIDSCASLDKVIEGLLQFSTISSNNNNLQNVDIATIIRSTSKSLYVTIIETGATINYPQSTFTIKGQPALIEQLFLNLVNNAIKFRKKNTPPVININFDDSDEEFLTVSISDNGIGIDPIFHKDIFQMFRKLHTSNEYLGSGIGLATCAKIIQKFGGNIWVQSEIGKGCTFFFTLPKAENLRSDVI